MAVQTILLLALLVVFPELADMLGSEPLGDRRSSLMPLNIHMLARIANDIYEDNDSKQRDKKDSHQRLEGTFVASNSTGFQGAIYQNEDETVVAYRGTASLGGATADIRLA